MEHCLLFTEQVTPKSAGQLIGYLNDLTATGTTKLTIAMSSPGGNVDAGVTAFNLIRAMPFPVEIHNVGSVNSIANVVFLAGATRKSNASGSFMFHGVGFEGSPGERLEEKNLLEKLETVKSGNERLAEIISAHSKLGLEDCVELFQKQTTRNAQWGLEAGLVHEISEFRIPAGADVKNLVGS